MPRLYRRLLALIVIGGGVIRFIVAFALGLPHLNTDSAAYLMQAATIRQGRWNDYFPNGYPAIIALVAPFVPDGRLEPALVLLNVIFSTSIIILTWDVSRRLSGPAPALGAAAVVACWPNQLNFTRYVLSEIPAALCIMLGAAGVSRGAAFLPGLAVGLATTIRSEFQIMWPAVAATMAWTGGLRAASRFAAGVAIPLALFLALALASNGRATLGRNIAENLVIAHNSDGGRLDFHWEPESADIKAAAALYIRDAQTNPLEFVSRRFKSLWELWGPWPGDGEPRSMAVRFAIGLRFPLILLALFAIPHARRDPVGLYLLFALAAVTLVHIVFFATPRYTVLVEPAAIVLAVDWVARVMGRAKECERGELNPHSLSATGS